ncbi:MAG: saccharopine dehydrogenase C-terminal domain-containing protein [Candidatus Nanopelagicales bacterium]
MNINFTGRVLVLGAGSVAQCTLPLILKHFAKPNQVTVIDIEDKTHRLKNEISQGVIFKIDKITKENLDSKLKSYLSSGDLLLDLAWNIDCNAILQWCHDNNVLYLNTSVEEWNPYVDGAQRPVLDRTLYPRHMRIRKMMKTWDKKGPSAVVEHGANPGLVSHFTKAALVEIANKLIAENKSNEKITKALHEEKYNELAYLLGVKVIHIAERDTQITDKPKKVDEFVNTWSVEGFYEEGIAPAEIGWGTHEKELPKNASMHNDDGPSNQIAIAQPGAKTWVRSWVPDFETIGMVIRHGEAFTITEHLTVKDESGKDLYRPTVHYAYCPSNEAIVSMTELEMRQWDLQKNQRILNEEIIDGEDRLGVLLMGHEYKSWWYGSMLSIHEARKLVPGQSATTLQVACSVLAAAMWMIENPNEGVLVPDQLPWKYVLDIATEYLGEMRSVQVDWDPLKTRNDLYKGLNGRNYDSDHCQFSNLLV